MEKTFCWKCQIEIVFKNGRCTECGERSAEASEALDEKISREQETMLREGYVKVFQRMGQSVDENGYYFFEVGSHAVGWVKPEFNLESEGDYNQGLIFLEDTKEYVLLIKNKWEQGHEEEGIWINDVDIWAGIVTQEKAIELMCKYGNLKKQKLL